ncbi:hypothetical protein Pcinc_027768 [Petrolisthes cinctipes]|uniref:Uncharacterized protein n=1 Tax=Petrolisthes cinctipes TaxID=88211 RepID=A0AAE1F4I6_PETCI|nr:hypothetical protein Pcinc_027768 [Petrolisthes cinctipes]
MGPLILTLRHPLPAGTLLPCHFSPLSLRKRTLGTGPSVGKGEFNNTAVSNTDTTVTSSGCCDDGSRARQHQYDSVSGREDVQVPPLLLLLILDLLQLSLEPTPV